MSSDRAGQDEVFAQDDPVGSAWRWLQGELADRRLPSLLVVIGLGHGDLLDALDRHAPHVRVLALEPDPRKAVEFLARPACQAWLSSRRLTCLVDPDYAGADEAWRVFPPMVADHHVVVMPGIATTHRDGAVRAARVLKRVVFGARANAEARRRFAPRYLANTLRNLPAIVAGQDVRALTDVYRGKPAIIAAAGPSLDAAIDDLHRVRDRALLIAADTALRPLLGAGLAPQLAIALDPSERNARHFAALPECGDTWLVSESAMDAAATAQFRDRTFWFRVADHHPWPWFNALGVDVGALDVWGSVLTGALRLAMLAGCDPIVLVGADLSFTSDRPYARGTTYEFDWTFSTAHGDELEHAWRMQMAMLEGIQVPDLHGDTIGTTTALQAFRDWILSRAAGSGRRVINATGAGILFGNGIEQSSLLEALPTRCELPALRSVVRVAPSTTPPSMLVAELRRVLGGLEPEASLGAPASEWAVFTGEPLHRESLTAALKAAVESLEHAEQSLPAHPMSIPWQALAEEPATQAVLVQRPEAMARLRAALNGTTVLRALPASMPDTEQDRKVRLAVALRLLEPLFEALSRFIEEPAAPREDAAGVLPAAGLCLWPDTIAWPTQIVEALLGGTCAAPWPSVGESFFWRGIASRDQRAVDEGAERDRRGVEPLAVHARATLALEWLVCACEQASPGRPLAAAVFSRLFAWSRAVADPASRAGSGAKDCAVVLRLEARTHDTCTAVDLPLGDERLLARAITGLVRTDPGIATMAAHFPLADTGAARQGASISVALRLADATCEVVPASATAAAFLLTPRILTDAGVARSFHLSATADGVMCAGHGERLSFLVTEHGEIRPHSESLQPIHGVSPAGADGPVPGRIAGTTCRSTDQGWTATAHRAADLIRIASPTGAAVSMTCHSPLTLAWSGASLLVATIDGELLFFEGLRAILERHPAIASSSASPATKQAAENVSLN